MDNTLLLTIFKSTGGLGVFLLGMVIMTDGLRSLAGDYIKKTLMYFTKTPYSGATTGAISTAILQSSSATTVAVVGFASAGLIAFPEALGIIFGANIGTTITGWLVALFGFKFQLGTIVLPFILVGVGLKLFFSDKIAAIGYALAGFGLIFVGITFLQEGMSGFEGIITPEILPSDTWLGRLKLLLLGILVTLITQSSSAGVATTLTALYAGTINFEQAAALVIGMDVGTTATALMASIGGSVDARRIGLSHVIYNIFTAIMALLLITPYTYILKDINPNILMENSEVSLVAFHTFFNLLGVIIILPFTGEFTKMMQRIIPSEDEKFTKNLDRQLLAEPNMALEATRISAQEIFLVLLSHINFILGGTTEDRRVDLRLLRQTLDNTQEYLDSVHPQQENLFKWEKMIALIQIIDHLQRMRERCEEDEERAKRARRSLYLKEEVQFIITQHNLIIEAIQANQFTKAKNIAQESETYINNALAPYRKNIAQKMANDELTMKMGTLHLQAMRWLVRVTHHTAQITYYLEESVMQSAT